MALKYALHTVPSLKYALQSVHVNLQGFARYLKNDTFVNMYKLKIP